MTLAIDATGTCEVCKKTFQRFSTMQRCCRTYRCAMALVKADKKAEAEKTRARRLAVKTIPEWRADAQAVFNRYCRTRDRLAGYGCICCGAPLDWNSGKPGGSVDAGHYVSRGSAIELAFDERNVNAQRKSCNRPGGATKDKFRAGMVERWGEAVVAELEGPHEVPHLKADDYRQIIKTYHAKLRELEKS